MDSWICASEMFSGPLSCYVDGSGGACARGGAWAATVAKVESRSLLVYDARKRGGRDHGRLLRAMPLDGSSVTPVEDPGGDAPGFDFVVAPRRGDPFAAIRLRALSAETRERSDFKKRHHAHLSTTDLRKKARALVAASANHVGTYVYDVFQHKTNGVSYTK